MANTGVQAENMPDFEHVNINEINPDFEAIPEDFYTLVLGKVDLKTFEGKATRKDGTPNPKAGVTQSILKLHVIITDDDEFSGRRVFPSIFEGSKKDYQFVARVARAVSMPQEPGETLFDYLSRVADSGASFKGKILKSPESDPYNENELDKFSVQAV